MNYGEGLLSLDSLLMWVYELCRSENVELEVTDDALECWIKVHDEIVEYRKKELYHDNGVSIKGKSLGQCVRVAGIMSLIRQSIEGAGNPEYVIIISVTKCDFELAINIVNHSVSTALELSKSPKANATDHTCQKQKNIPPLSKVGVPNPENMSMDFLIQHSHHVKNIMSTECVKLSVISGNNMYPSINRERGTSVAYRFVQGMCHLGFGRMIDLECKSGYCKAFKRYHPDDCPDGKENFRYKLMKLDIEI